jgi:hypothetical protein
MMKFGNLNNMLAGYNGDVVDESPVDPSVEMVPEMEIDGLEDFEDMDPEDILDMPNVPIEMQKMALQQIKDRYLKPREDDNE